LWSRVVERTGARARDQLYRLYSAKIFETLVVDPTTDSELFDFVEETKTRGPRFSNYSAETVETFVSRIYELRKDNSNNTAG